ncbi:MAG: alanine racemase, partial [Desulfovibrionales bacterium]|nr:alanine racemase [Desulfovibrionales bacterium]
MLKVEIDLKAIQHNYRVLCSKTAGKIMPVVKADAYGHGMEKTAQSLLTQGVQTFAVGTIDEGIALRQSLSDVGIYSLLGPLSPEDFNNVYEYRITPVLHSWFQLKQLVQSCPPGIKIEVGIKFDTGMGRLGFEPGQAREIALYLAANQCLVPEMIISHLSCADVPQMESRVLEQSEILDTICSVFSRAKFHVQKSLANSAAILSLPAICKGLSRPGIALYGGNPFAGTCWQDKGTSLKQAMSVKAPILSVHDLAKGQGISYGLTF